ncbi:polymorphic toxin type 44 domain-containing protein [Serratia marcescens]|uniref:polymorphic toxin type 44 domain-containing protein n=1 Tax=Serratia marcescens TaxID=615 RepID=UPI0024072198|nr:polymorphic toxin type 44 domain-containing protein [Serratia marcescens]MDF9721857.1 polymorphic toxin type 44 domain-containing protein [Serratia marcescens]
MAKGYYLVQGDMTSCGGKIVDGASDHRLFGKAIACERDQVTCGRHPGMYMIAGGIADDSIHGRKMAGTLDSTSSCPCRAHFVPSMMRDSYEKGGQCSNTSFSLDELMALLQEPYKNLHQDDEREHHCTHTDGAIQVAEYILSEIKTNVRSQTAETIRYLIDEGTLRQRWAEWEKLPFYAKMVPPPQPDLLAAMAIWYQTVKTGAIWDHKPIIRKKFVDIAVTRRTERGNISKSHYHKYKMHDYFLDVWSNIHYGYVGLSVGFDELLLLKGSTWEQNMTPGAMGDDTIDDVTSIKIGFYLHHEYGRFADNLSAQDILNALELVAGNKLPNSRDEHWCWSAKNPERLSSPRG